MRQLKTSELTPGIIIAQHILSEDNDILLAAGSALSAKVIASLHAWNVTEVRIKEETDTDEDIEMAIQFDEISRQHAKKTAKPVTVSEEPEESEPPLQLEIKPELPLPSIINEKSVQQYETLHQRFHALLKNSNSYTDPGKLADLANIICR